MKLPHWFSSPRFFPALMGAFGVAMGFAAFVLVREETRSPHASSTFLWGLLAAAATSYAIEAVRERAEGHEKSAVAPGRVLGLLVLMAVFEVYVSGAEQVVKLVAAGEAETFIRALFASGITADLGTIAQLLLFAGLWIVIGAASAWSMLRRAPAASVDMSGAAIPSGLSAWREALQRVAGGLLLVALISLAYVLLARMVLTLWVLLMRPQDYAPAFSTLLTETPTTTGNPMAQLPFLLASALEALAHTGRWGGVALLVVIVGLVLVLRWIIRVPTGGFAMRIVIATIALALVLLALGPFATSATQFGRLVRIVTATTLTWLAPLVVLSVATPLLRTPSRSPRIWGLVAFAVAVLLVLVTWGRLSAAPAPQFVAVLVLAMVVTAWLFWRGADVVKFWPLVALTLAIAAFEGSTLLQQLSFLTTFKEAALLQTAPLTGGDEVRATRGYRAVAQWAVDSMIDARTAQTVASVRDLSDTLSAIDLTARASALSQQLDSVYASARGSICQSMSVPLLDTLHRDISTWCRRVEWLGTMTALDSLARAMRSDSARHYASALIRAEQPWGNTLDTLLAGADDDVTRAWYRFRWADTASTESRELSARVAAILPSDVNALDPILLMDRAMDDRALDPTSRLWMILASFARTAPPDASFAVWMNDFERRAFAESRAGDGLLMATVLSWWRQRAQHLGNLVEARYLSGIPSTPPPTGLVRVARRIDRFDREVRAVSALRFASDQLAARQRAQRAGASLSADPDASKLLELSLGASFAFWATAGLLAGLARTRHPHDGPEPA